MNLFDFLRLIYKKLTIFFKWVLNVILGTVHMCLRYWYVMVLCVALGFCVARLWLHPRLTRFDGYATITFASGMKPMVEEGLSSFFCESSETKRDLYGLPMESQLAVKKFTTYNVIDAKCDGDVDYTDRNNAIKSTDSLNTIIKDQLTIRLELFGHNDFEHWEQAMTQWFNDQEKFTKADSLRKNALRERLAYINHEIERTDSFMSHFYFSDRPQSQQVNVYNDEVDKDKQSTLIYDEMLELLGEKQAIEYSLEQNRDVINFQTHFHFEIMLPKTKYIICLCFGFGLGILLSLVIKYWNNVKKFTLSK